MKRSRIYLKYKQERVNARLLRNLKNQYLSNKVPETAVKVNPKTQQSVRVSLPIKHFINIQNKRCTLINNSIRLKDMNDTDIFKVPKLVVKVPREDSKNVTKKLREVRRNRNESTTEQKKNANEIKITISKKHILKELSVVLTRDLKDISNNMKSSPKDDISKGNNQRTQFSKTPVVQGKIIIPVKRPNGKETYTICYTIAEAKKAFNITQTSIDTQTEPSCVIEKLKQHGILKPCEKSLKKKSQNCELKSADESEIIDLDLISDNYQLNQERLSMALSHSDANKTILKVLQEQMIKPTTDRTVEMSRPKRAGTPFPFVNSNFASPAARVNTPAKVFFSASNVVPAFMHPSAATTFSDSQSMPTASPKRIIDYNQQAKDSTQAYDGHDRIRYNVSNINQGNDKVNEVNLKTLAEMANSLNKINFPPIAVALKKNYQLQHNMLAQRQLKKAQELQSHKQITQPYQLLPPKSQPANQQPQSQLTQPQVSISQSPSSQPLQPQSTQQQRQEIQPHFMQPRQLQLSRSQSSKSPPPQIQLLLQQPPPSQPLQPQSTQQQLQQMQPHILQPAQPPLLRSKILRTQLPLQQPPPSQHPQIQPLQLQLQHHPPPQPSQMPRPQLPPSYGAQQWQQQLYFDQQQQNAQYTPTQPINYPNDPNVCGTRNQNTIKAKRGDSYLHPGDPRKPRPQYGSTARPSSGYSRMISYEDRFRLASNVPYPNYFPQQMHWNNPNHYW